MTEPQITAADSAAVSSLVDDVLRYAVQAGESSGLDLDDVGVIIAFRTRSTVDRVEPFRALASVRANIDLATNRPRVPFDPVELASLFLSGTGSILESIGVKFDLAPIAQAVDRTRQGATARAHRPAARGTRAQRRRPRGR